MLKLNKIYNQDCFEGLKQIDDKSIDLIITDPPYWHKKSPGKPYSMRHQSNTDSTFSNSSLYNSDCEMMKTMSDFNDECINRLMPELKRVMLIMNAYIFCSETQVPYYAMWAEQNKLMFSILVWEKPLSIINKNRFSQNLEYIVRVYDYGTGLNRLDESFLYNRVKKETPIKGKGKLHPTQKPVELIEEFVKLSSKEEDIILDPFIGSGSTALACIKNKRNFIGFETEEKYCNISNERIKNLQLELF